MSASWSLVLLKKSDVAVCDTDEDSLTDAEIGAVVAVLVVLEAAVVVLEVVVVVAALVVVASVIVSTVVSASPPPSLSCNLAW